MKISDTYLNIGIGANLVPDGANISGLTRVGIEHKAVVDGVSSVLLARLSFSAAGQTVLLNSNTGELTPSVAGTKQFVTRQVSVVPGGVTGATSINVTVTSANITGSPLTVLVPVIAGWTAAQVAAAIAAKFTATPAISDHFSTTSSYADVNMTSIYGYADDATLAISISAAAGISNGPTAKFISALGVLIDRPGGNGKDIYAGTWKGGYIRALTIKGVANGPGSVGTAGLGPIYKDEAAAISYGSRIPDSQITFTAAGGRAIVDVMAIFKS